MKKHFGLLLGLCAVLALGGCDDSSDPAADGGGTGGNGSDGGGSGGGGSDGGGADPGDIMTCFDPDALEVSPNPTMKAPVYKCDENPSELNKNSRNLCRNKRDCAIIATDKVRDTAKDCGLSCLGQPTCDELLDCSEGCMINNTFIYDPNPNPEGMSPECATCYSDISACALKFCFEECIDDPDSGDCVLCQLENGCRIPFEKCSGLDREDML